MSGQLPDWPGDPVLPQPDYPAPLQTSMKTQIFIAMAIGAVFALFVYGIRAPAARALGAGLVVAAGSLALLRAMDLIRIQWPIAPTSRAVRSAGIPRWRLNGFDAMTDSRPVLSPDLRLRLAGLATAILVRRGLTAGSAGAVGLLGAATHELLFRSDRARTDPSSPDPSPAQITAMIDRLIELGDPDPRSGPDGAGPLNPLEQIVEMEGNK